MIEHGIHKLLYDTTGELQVHLKSDHQHSELNLGHITRIPDESGRADFRGEGFELRTDGHGVVRVTSTEGSITLTSPNEICLRAGESELKINSGGVFVTTPGVFKAKASMHDLVEPGSVEAVVPEMPKLYKLRFYLQNDEKIPYRNTPYIMRNNSTGEEFEGVTDDGHTQLHYAKTAENFEINLQIKGM